MCFVTDFVAVSADIPFFVLCACVLSQLTLQKAYIMIWKHFENTDVMKSRLSFLQEIAKMI